MDVKDNPMDFVYGVQFGWGHQLDFLFACLSNQRLTYQLHGAGAINQGWISPIPQGYSENTKFFITSEYIIMQNLEHHVRHYSKIHFGQQETLGSPGWLHAVSEDGVAVVETVESTDQKLSVAPIRDLVKPHHHLQIPTSVASPYRQKVCISRDGRVVVTFLHGSSSSICIFDDKGEYRSQ